jgi:hypothetical protein
VKNAHIFALRLLTSPLGLEFNIGQLLTAGNLISSIWAFEDLWRARWPLVI